MTQNSINTKNPCIQFVYNSISDYQACTTSMATSTLPNNTEGDEVLTLSITPTNASNYLLIEFQGWITSKYSIYANIALFQDDIDDALSATRAGITNDYYTNQSSIIYLKHTMVAGTTSSTTFKIRIGQSSLGSTIYINGFDGSREFGGVASTNLTIMEIKA